MKVSTITGEPVVSVAGAERLGSVDDFFINPADGAILGMRVKRGGLFSKGEAVLMADVQSIGLDAVTLPDTARLLDEKKFREFDNSTTTGKIIGSRMMTEHGHEVGTISDLDADFENGIVTGYFLAGSLMDRLRRDDHLVPASAVKSIGDSLVVVDNSVETP